MFEALIPYATDFPHSEIDQQSDTNHLSLNCGFHISFVIIFATGRHKMLNKISVCEVELTWEVMCVNVSPILFCTCSRTGSAEIVSAVRNIYL